MPPSSRDPRLGQILSIVKAISVQIMEVEKRIEGVELRLRQGAVPLIDLTLDDDDDDVDYTTTDSSSEGYQSAPASFSYGL
tara:strand:- start:452 stop:694 length:243 start_codon:yes stop_codon:yes gene_type:complete